MRATNASTSSNGTVSSRVPAMHSVGTRTSGKAGKPAGVLEELEADTPHAPGRVVRRLEPRSRATLDVGRPEARAPPLEQAERGREEDEPLDGGDARGRQRGEVTAERAADDRVRRLGAAERRLGDGEHRRRRGALEAVRPGGEVRDVERRAERGEPLGEDARLVRGRAGREAVEVEEHGGGA